MDLRPAPPPPPAHVPLRPGQVMHGKNDYTIVRTLGKGGFGTVYMATHRIGRQAKKEVVIKEMIYEGAPSDLQEMQKARERFEAEADTLVQLANSGIPGIPDIYEYFTDNGRNYIAMEYIRGENLEKGMTHVDDEHNLIEGGTYTPEEVRRWGIRLCQVLDSLAQVGLTHRDIKPANLIVNPAGEIYLVDFGTARAQSGVPMTGSPANNKSSAYGTPGYASPEQYQGNVEPRSDVYALAATLYHLLTDDDPGSHPFSFPKLPELPSDLGNALGQALVQDVQQRITAEQFGKLLEPQVFPGAPASPRVFTWRDGTRSRNPFEFVKTADRQWEEAREHLYQGRLEIWLAFGLSRNDLAARAEQIRQTRTDQDLGLEEMLLFMVPKLARATFQVLPGKIEVGNLNPDASPKFTLQLTNPGRGCLVVSLGSRDGWIKVPKASASVKLFAKQSVSLDVIVKAANIPALAAANGVIVASASTGQSVHVPVTAAIPRWQAIFYHWAPTLDWGALGGLAIGALFGLVGAFFFGLTVWPVWLPLLLLALLTSVGAFMFKEGFELSALRIAGAGAGTGAIVGVLVVYITLNSGPYDVEYLQGVLMAAQAGVLVAIWFFYSDANRTAFIYAVGGALAGAGFGFALDSLAPRITAWMGTPLKPLLLGLSAGMLLGTIYQRVVTPSRWANQGRLTRVAYPLLALAGLAWGVYWAITELPLIYHYNQATTAQKQGDWPGAWSEFWEVLNRRTSFRDAYSQMLVSGYNAGQACFAGQDFSCAETYFCHTALEIAQYRDSQAMCVASRAEPSYQRCLVFLVSEQWEQAAAECEQTLVTAPGYKDAQAKLIDARAEPHYRAGKEHLATQRWEQAEAEFLAVVQIDPGYKDTQALLVQARVEQDYLEGKDHLSAKRWEQAIAAFDRVLAAAPGYQDAPVLRTQAYNGMLDDLYVRGSQALEAEQWELSAQAFARLRQYDPAYGDLPALTQNPDLRQALRAHYAGRWQSAPAQVQMALALETPILAMALCPYADWLATGGQDGTIRLWDVNTGQELRTIEAHPGGVNALAFSPICGPPTAGGQNCQIILASGGADETAKIWDLETNAPLQTLALHSNAVTAVAFSPDGAYLATLDRGVGFRIWQTSSGVFLHLQGGDYKDIQQFSFGTPGSVVASVIKKIEVKLVDGQRGVLLKTIVAPKHLAGWTGFSPDGRYLAALAQDGKILFWDVSELITAHNRGNVFFQEASVEMPALAFFPDGRWLFSLFPNGLIQAWSLPEEVGAARSDPSWSQTIPEAVWKPETLAFSSDGWLLGVLTDTGKVLLYEPG